MMTFRWTIYTNNYVGQSELVECGNRSYSCEMSSETNADLTGVFWYVT
jgi:hypothetical protein